MCSSNTRRWIGGAAALILVTWIAILGRFREAEPLEPPLRPDLRVWDMPGCYRLSSQAWPDSSGVDALPGHLLLVADSLDQWGRAYDTYRAEVLEEVEEAVRPDAADYRWFVRADTLWVVWSQSDVRGGLALRRSADGLLGRARVGGDGAPVDVTARVQAWRVNCSTRQLESPGRLRR